MNAYSNVDYLRGHSARLPKSRPHISRPELAQASRRVGSRLLALAVIATLTSLALIAPPWAQLIGAVVVLGLALLLIASCIWVQNNVC